jgi:hypothetical protein
MTVRPPTADHCSFACHRAHSDLRVVGPQSDLSEGSSCAYCGLRAVSLGLVTTWDELKIVLARLRNEQPGMLAAYPTPDVDEGRQPPFRIRLAAWAAIAAEELHRQFGDSVDLTVGALPYPPGRQLPQHPVPAESVQLFDPRDAVAELDGPAIVESGSSLVHGLLLTNLARRELQIATNGHVTPAVVDPVTGARVGGFSGAQILPLIVFRVSAGETERIPMLIGTDSSMPEMGFAIPPGDWGLQITLKLGPRPTDSVRRRLPTLPLKITARQELDHR